MLDGKPPKWPEGRRFSISLTFDVDAESPVLPPAADGLRRPSVISEWRYGAQRGLARIRHYLRSREIRATFYVPGYTALTYPRQIQTLAEDGHEIGHHGQTHRNPEQLSADDQRRELEEGLDSLQRVAGLIPAGYRAPYFGLTEETASLLHEHGFDFDSSCMGDDLPYFEQLGGGPLLELPVQWTMDDGVFLAWTEGGHPPSVESWVESWSAEVEQARGSGGHLSFVCHPHWTGRPRQFEAFTRMLDHIQERGDAWIAPHREVATIARSHLEGKHDATY